MPLTAQSPDERSFSNPAKGAAFLILVSLTLSAAIPYGVYTTNLWDSTTYQMDPEPITSSVFSNFTDNGADSLILPHPYSLISQRPFVVIENYSKYVPEILITYDEALVTARNWLTSVGPSFIAWNLIVSSSSIAPPSWTFRFSYPGFTSYVIVETITGHVIEFEIVYLHDFDPTPLTLEEAEELTYAFLVEHNISIPDTARYIKGLQYDCQRFYSIVFQEFVGPVKIDASQIVVRASAFTRGISYFKHSWFGLDEIDLSNIISPNVVQTSAEIRLAGGDELIPEISNQSDVIWENSELTLLGVIDPAISSSIIHRLVWVTNLFLLSSRMSEIRLYSDPYSSNLFGFRSPSSSYATVLEMSTFYSSEFLLGSSVVFLILLLASASSIVLVIYKRKN